MDNIIFEIYTATQNLFTKFASHYKGKTQKDIKAFVEKDLVFDQISEIIKHDLYDSNDIYVVIKPLIDDVFGHHKEEDWLFYAYQYALYLSFPAATIVKLEDEKNIIANFILMYLRIYFNAQKECNDKTWQSIYPLKLLSESEFEGNKNSDSEYRRFLKSFDKEYVYEMMKLNQDVVGYSTLDHISGVHHLAVKIARQLKHLGIKVDLTRVSGAAAGHDIGKFGCKKSEARRVAYYHYYYTGEWFDNRNIVYIRNVAINHSTWDLELDNLSIESLILIYCDFRVKNNEDKSSPYPMKIYSLDDAFEVILEKLDNVDQAKEDRYRKVYARLKDFENFMKLRKVCLNEDFNEVIEAGYKTQRQYFSLMQGEDVVENAKFLSISHNIELMYMFRDETSLNAMLENARGINNQISLRGYLESIEEYFTYLTQKQKLITLKFLYEKLIAPSEDIRKHASQLIGLLIASFDEEIRKEIPESVQMKKPDITSLMLFETYLAKYLYPDQKIIGKHKKWIGNSLQYMIESVLKIVHHEEIESYLAVFTKFLNRERNRTDYNVYLINCINLLDFEDMSDDYGVPIIKWLASFLDASNFKLKLFSVDVLLNQYYTLSERVIRVVGIKAKMKRLTKNDMSEYPSENYIKFKAAKLLKYSEEKLGVLREICLTDLEKQSELFLSNLKSATHWTRKKLQVELLIANVINIDQSESFYTAMHLCNLLKVSAHEQVRNAAGRGLIDLAPYLQQEQINDIVVELLRALEMESYQYTKYIPEYLGELLLSLEVVEFNEILDNFKEKIKRSNPQICVLILKTVGVIIEKGLSQKDAGDTLPMAYDEFIRVLVGILLNGFVNYNAMVNQGAINVIGKDIFDSAKINLEDKYYIFQLIGKKIMALMVNTNENDELVFINNSAGIKHIYSFISEYIFEKGSLDIKSVKNVAFFPGAFDPFSLSHKEIAKSIRDLGFEVYLAVDEFSWSKRTHPNLIRRDIMKMSVADELGIYVFPRDFSINIANTKDMKLLRSLFPKSDVHMVVGSDVIKNASAYKKEYDENSVASFSHIVFERAMAGNNKVEEDHKAYKSIDGNVIKLNLPEQYEHISSTQIRNYIDENRDISDLIDPLAQKYIYERGLYLREPQFKEVMTTKSLKTVIYDEISDTLAREILMYLNDHTKITLEEIKDKISKNSRILVMRSLDQGGKIVGFSIFHWLRAFNIYGEFKDQGIGEYIRANSTGRLVIIDCIFGNKKSHYTDSEQMVLTETLAFCLAKDYSYCVYSNLLGIRSRSLDRMLSLQGFVKVHGDDINKEIYAVNMSTPCTLSLDARSMIKEPLRSNSRVIKVIVQTRRKLQRELTKLYPGNLVLSFDRALIYENLIKKICEENEVSTLPTIPRVTGESMCVPFGNIFNRWILPNTVTKAFHTERFFTPDVARYTIAAYPYYLDIENQVSRIKSFDRSVMLVDDLLNKGYRMKAISPLFKRQGVTIKKLFVGIMSGRGKALAEMDDIPVDAAYFIPRLKVWFNESHMYPFIGGDTLWRGVNPDRNIIPSINLILPYTYPKYIGGAEKRAIFTLSKVCIENAIEILTVLEEEYQNLHERSLTMAHLSEVLVSPRFPDHGANMSYDMNQRPSDYLKNDLEQLFRLEKICE